MRRWVGTIGPTPTSQRTREESAGGPTRMHARASVVRHRPRRPTTTSLVSPRTHQSAPPARPLPGPGPDEVHGGRALQAVTRTLGILTRELPRGPKALRIATVTTGIIRLGPGRVRDEEAIDPSCRGQARGCLWVLHVAVEQLPCGLSAQYRDCARGNMRLGPGKVGGGGDDDPSCRGYARGRLWVLRVADARGTGTEI